MIMCVCQLRASFTSFGQMLRCARKRIVNNKNVHRKEQYTGLIIMIPQTNIDFIHVLRSEEFPDRRDVYAALSMDLCDR